MSPTNEKRHVYLEPRPGPYQAQHGEDRWLEAYFKGEPGFFVEVGAYDGIVLSNTYFLESIGWSGILIEPDPAKAARCRANRPKARVYECAAVASDATKSITFNVVEGGEVYSAAGELTELQQKRLQGWGLTPKPMTVAARTLDSMLAEVAPPRVDFVSIDVEGGEVDVLRGFDLARWRPRVVMVEVNSRVRSTGVREAFTRQGYVYLESIDINQVYVPMTELRTLAAAVDGARYAMHLSRKAVVALGRRAKKLVGAT
jgi:FkbM family methyltransferase